MMKAVHEMPGGMRLASAAVPTRWAFESMVLLEAQHSPEGPPVLKTRSEEAFDRLKPETDTGSSETYCRPDIAHSSFPETKLAGMVIGSLILFGMLAGLVGANFLLLRARDLH